MAGKKKAQAEVLVKIANAADAGELRDIANALDERTDEINRALIARLDELTREPGK